jgi:hypothetical protein
MRGLDKYELFTFTVKGSVNSIIEFDDDLCETGLNSSPNFYPDLSLIDELNFIKYEIFYNSIDLKEIVVKLANKYNLELGV